MIKTTDFTEGNWALSRSYLSTGPWEEGNGSYRQSVFRHPRGLVEIYEQNGREMTNMRLRHGAREYWRHWDKLWGEKTVARLAREFIEDVVQ